MVIFDLKYYEYEGPFFKNGPFTYNKGKIGEVDLRNRVIYFDTKLKLNIPKFHDFRLPSDKVYLYHPICIYKLYYISRLHIHKVMDFLMKKNIILPKVVIL